MEGHIKTWTEPSNFTDQRWELELASSFKDVGDRGLFEEKYSLACNHLHDLYYGVALRAQKNLSVYLISQNRGR